MELRIKIPFPEDPTRRAFVIAAVCSVLLHVLLLGSLIAVNTFGVPAYVKRGEPLFVDLAPDKPEEKAPLGNPSRPVGPEPPPPTKAPEPPAPRPKIAEAPPPKPPPPARAPAPPRPAPEPAKQVARAEPAAAAPKAPEPPAAKAPGPEPAKPAEPQPAARPGEPAPPSPQPAEAPKPQQAPPAQSSASPGGRQSTQTALAKPPAPEPPSIFRDGGGLRGGRGGVEGEPIPLDTPEPKYQDYFNKIREKIKANWIYPREAGDRGIQGELLIEFHIAKDGRLEYLALRHSSGEEILDRFAMNAVRLAQPFPPVPDDIAKRMLAINGMFRYQIVGASLLNQYLR